MDNENETVTTSYQDRAAISVAMCHNDPLTEELEEVVRKQVARGEAWLALLDKRIDMLEDSLREIRQSRQKEAAQIDKYHATNSSHRKLAPELLSTIFKYTLKYVELPYRFKNSPFTLMRVCAKWRQVAFYTPTLWSSIYIDNISKKVVSI